MCVSRASKVLKIARQPRPSYHPIGRMISAETNNPASPAPAWDDALLANPHAVADKRSRVQRMFAAIAPSYDLNNRLHSLWMDQRWRRRAVRVANLKWSDQVVDVACGTGDLTFEFVRGLVRAAGGGENK